MYLAIKEMSSVASDVIIVTSSLTKDMTGKEDSHREPAIRALCQITDVRLLFYRLECKGSLFTVGFDDAKCRTMHETSDCR
jgi:hypothetical protein